MVIIYVYWSQGVKGLIKKMVLPILSTKIKLFYFPVCFKDVLLGLSS